ncbi:hypothetical protein [Methanofollis sp. UBA420]|jgi:hypothetical protein|uniref:hypothetical protein n=1 Tax=Methanofollis sp. UBA420 TaxID=1915514 RepID=UPI00316AD5CD
MEDHETIPGRSPDLIARSRDPDPDPGSGSPDLRSGSTDQGSDQEKRSGDQDPGSEIEIEIQSGTNQGPVRRGDLRSRSRITDQDPRIGDRDQPITDLDLTGRSRSQPPDHDPDRRFLILN